MGSPLLPWGSRSQRGGGGHRERRRALEGEKASAIPPEASAAPPTRREFARDTRSGDVLATRHARDAELARRMRSEADGFSGQARRQELECFDDPECAFVKTKLFRW